MPDIPPRATPGPSSPFLAPASDPELVVCPWAVGAASRAEDRERRRWGAVIRWSCGCCHEKSAKTTVELDRQGGFLPTSQIRLVGQVPSTVPTVQTPSAGQGPPDDNVMHVFINNRCLLPPRGNQRSRHLSIHMLPRKANVFCKPLSASSVLCTLKVPSRPSQTRNPFLPASNRPEIQPDPSVSLSCGCSRGKPPISSSISP